MCSSDLYLWHWIVFQLTRPSIDLVGDDWALYALRVLIVFALADISLRYIEIPVRRGYFELWFRGMKYRTKAVRVRQQLSTLATVLVIISATSLVSISAMEKADRIAAQEKAATNQDENNVDQVITAEIGRAHV